MNWESRHGGRASLYLIDPGDQLRPSSILRCIACFSEVVSEAQDNLGVTEIVFEESPRLGAGSGPDAHEGLEDGVFHLSVVGRGVDGADGG